MFVKNFAKKRRWAKMYDLDKIIEYFDYKIEGDFYDISNLIWFL